MTSNKRKTVTCQMSEPDYLILLKLRQKLNMPITDIMREALKLFILQNQ